MEGFFLWLQIESPPLTTNKYGNVAACCFTAEEWSMQKALGESEPSNKSIVPVLVWIPKNVKLWKIILKSLQEIFFFPFAAVMQELAYSTDADVLEVPLSGRK